MSISSINKNINSKSNLKFGSSNNTSINANNYSPVVELSVDELLNISNNKTGNSISEEEFNSLSDVEQIRLEVMMQKKMSRGKESESHEKISAINKEKLDELSNKLIETAQNEFDNKANMGEYIFYDAEGHRLAWCANFATWVWGKSSVDGKSAYDIAKLNSNITSSTGQLMMHFLTADHPDLGFDYTGCKYYDPEINNNIAFYYNDSNPKLAGKNSGKLPNGVSNYVPKPGDLVFFDNYDTRGSSIYAGHAENWVPFIDDSVQDHTGIVKSVETDSSGKVTKIVTLEGNITINDVNTFKEREITLYDDNGNFNTNDVYSSGLIGFGTITNMPS